MVVAVGMVGMDVPRNAYYEKELQLRLSRSYGPGRYDRTYEEDGVDYPIGYVRWTEQRNMAAFLDLVAQGKLQPSRLVTHRFPIAEAEQAYRVVSGEAGEPYLGILIEYPRDETVEPAATRVELTPRPLERATVRLGVVGAGNFARSVLLPRVRQLDVQLRGRGHGVGAERPADWLALRVRLCHNRLAAGRPRRQRGRDPGRHAPRPARERGRRGAARGQGGLSREADGAFGVGAGRRARCLALEWTAC